MIRALGATVLAIVFLIGSAVGPEADVIASGCPLDAVTPPGEDTMTPTPVAFWAGTLVSDPALLEQFADNEGDKALSAVRSAMRRQNRGLPAFFEAVGDAWIQYVGDFGGLRDKLGKNPMADTSRRYLGVMVSIDRRVRFDPNVVEMGSGVKATQGVQWLFGSVNLFDVRAMSIAYSFPFFIHESSHRGDLSGPGALVRRKIDATVAPLGDRKSPLVQQLSCQLRGAVLRHLGLSKDMRPSSEGGVDAAIFLNGIQDFRVCDGCIGAQGDLPVTKAAARRLKELVTYMTRVKVARARPVAPLANANSDLVQRQGRKGIRAVYDDDVKDAGEMCGMWGERVSWSEDGDRVACFEVPSFGRNVVLGARLGSKVEVNDNGYATVRIDSILDVMLKEGPRQSVAQFPGRYDNSLGKLDATEVSDVYFAEAVASNVSAIDFSQLEK